MAPGVHELGVRVVLHDTRPATIFRDAPSFVEVIDSDTGETLERIELPFQERSLMNRDVVIWPLQVRTFTQ